MRGSLQLVKGLLLLSGADEKKIDECIQKFPDEAAATKVFIDSIQREAYKAGLTAALVIVDDVNLCDEDVAYDNSLPNQSQGTSVKYHCDLIHQRIVKAIDETITM